LESRVYPLLWDGAYSDYEKYTQEDIMEVVGYAKKRGIRVMAEIDLPGHAQSWCVGYPDVCPDPNCNSPLDPSSDLTWNVIQGLFTELIGMTRYDGLFGDDFFHLGGDEVDESCWNTIPHVVAWLKANNMTSHEAYMYFVQFAHNVAISAGRSPVNWEEVYNNFGTKLDKETIVHIWLDKDTLSKVVADGYRAILSDNDLWYLDHLQITWDAMYTNEPFEKISDPSLQALVLGGEACMWGETVDPSDLHQTVWPRAAAFAERMWSARNVNDVAIALPRLETFRCLLTRRGIAAAPVNNDMARSAPPGPGGCYVQ